MITETKNIIIISTALIGIIIYTILKNLKESERFDKEYDSILKKEEYKVKGQYN